MDERQSDMNEMTVISIRRYEDGRVEVEEHTEHFQARLKSTFWESVLDGVSMMDSGFVKKSKSESYTYEMWACHRSAVAHMQTFANSWRDSGLSVPFVTYFYSGVISGARDIIQGLLISGEGGAIQ